uniref:Uncharacterized protein n=1 Tax=Sphaerodactylus townsendi TaxID=933632 RepID=A0ACB8G3Y8_9SAUR
MGGNFDAATKQSAAISVSTSEISNSPEDDATQIPMSQMSESMWRPPHNEKPPKPLDVSAAQVSAPPCQDGVILEPIVLTQTLLQQAALTAQQAKLGKYRQPSRSMQIIPAAAKAAYSPPPPVS